MNYFYACEYTATIILELCNMLIHVHMLFVEDFAIPNLYDFIPCVYRKKKKLV